MIRKALLAMAAAVALAPAAHAADMPTKSPSVYSPTPVTNWTGFYIGLNAGYGWANAAATVVGGGATFTGSENLNGAIGGGQIGYNWQTGNLVFGLEADIQASGQSHTTAATVAGVAISAKDQITYFGTIRPRLGVAIGSWMPYVTAGWGYGGVKSTFTAGAVSVSATDSHSMWTAGAGIEAWLAPRWSWKIEYLYLDTGNIRSNFTLGGVAFAQTVRLKDNIARLGVNYHF